MYQERDSRPSRSVAQLRGLFLGAVWVVGACAAGVDRGKPFGEPTEDIPGGQDGGSVTERDAQASDAAAAGGSLGADARMMEVAMQVDAGATTGADGGAAGLPGGPLAPVAECGKSIDRIKLWEGTGEGATTPLRGSLLLKDGQGWYAKQEWRGGGWHVLAVLISNSYSRDGCKTLKADLSTSTRFVLTYSSKTDMSLQMRPANHFAGGNQYTMKIPSTGGQKVTREFSLAKSAWGRSVFGTTPPWSFEDALRCVQGFVFVGREANTVTFQGLRFDRWTPTCR